MRETFTLPLHAARLKAREILTGTAQRIGKAISELARGLGGTVVAGLRAAVKSPPSERACPCEHDHPLPNAH